MISTYWKVSCEPGADFLHMGIFGTDNSPFYSDSISGEINWRLVTISIPGGTYVIKWKYSKDLSIALGQDCGWVDQVVWTGKAVREVTPIAAWLLTE
jgi:hypothetical protein